MVGPAMVGNRTSPNRPGTKNHKSKKVIYAETIFAHKSGKDAQKKSKSPCVCINMYDR